MPLAPPSTKQGFRTHHWYLLKWEPGKMDESVKPPEGMAWLLCPPNRNVLSDEVKWFPTGHQAIDYLIAKRDDIQVDPLASGRI